MDLSTTVPVIYTGIAWTTDKEVKFKNPEYWNNTIMPKNWHVNESSLKNGYQKEDLIVWMRTAALPSFQKFYRLVGHQKNSSF